MTRSGGHDETGFRILVVNWLDRENPKAGGAEEHLHEVFGRLASRGHRVTALVSGWPDCAPRAELDGIQVHRTGGRHTFSLAAPRYYREHFRGAFDVVVEDLNKVPLFAPLWAGTPVVLLAHHLFGATAFQAGPAPLAAATWALERPIPLVYRRTPTIAVSESTRDDLVSRGLRRDDVVVVPNGIDLAHFTPDETLKSVSPTLLYIGRLRKYKRVDLVIRAVARLRGEGMDVALRVAGSGDEASALEALAASLDVSDAVSFPGYVPEEQKLDLLRSSWIHLLTSPKEGWGISNLEAAACGTPTVASDAPGLRESVVDGKTGLLVPHGDVPALAQAIRRIVAAPDLRARLARQARAFAETFSWDASTDAIEAVLKRVVGAPAVR